MHVHHVCFVEFTRFRITIRNWLSSHIIAISSRFPSRQILAKFRFVFVASGLRDEDTERSKGGDY